MKIIQVLDLLTVCRDFVAKPMPIKTAYKFTKLINKLSPEQEFYQEHLMEIIKKYCEMDEDGNPIPTEDGNGVKIKEEFIEECNKAAADLQDIEIELPDLKFTIDELDGIEVTPQQMNLMMPIIED